MRQKLGNLSRRLANLVRRRDRRAYAVPPLEIIRDIERFAANGDDVADVVLLGDSVMERVSRSDVDQRTLAQMIRDNCAPDLRVTHVSFSGCHPRAFLALVRLITSFSHHPALIVVPVNIRSFSPQWHMNPSWRYDCEIECFEEYARTKKYRFIKKPLITMEAEKRKFQDLPISIAGFSGSHIGDVVTFIEGRAEVEYEPIRRGVIFAFHYLSALHEDHPHLYALREIKALAESAGIRLIFYVTPLNVQGGERYCGQSFREVVDGNRHLIQSALAGAMVDQLSECDVLDFSFALEASEFFSEHEATEHLNENGRRKLAALVTQSIVENFSRGSHGAG